MALPPWLNIQPSQFLQATQAGTQAGLQLRAQQVAQQQAAQDAQIRRDAQDEMRRIKQFEQQQRIAEAAARQKSDDLHMKLAFAQEERQMKALANQEIQRRAAAELAQKRFDAQQNALKAPMDWQQVPGATPGTMAARTSTGGIALSRPFAPKSEKPEADKLASDLNKLSRDERSANLTYLNYLKALDDARGPDKKAVQGRLLDANAALMDISSRKKAMMDKFKASTGKDFSPYDFQSQDPNDSETQNESPISLPSNPAMDIQESVQELIYDSKTKSFKPAGE